MAANANADVIVVGGGHNGLACAILLAKAGKKVLVLERRAQAGGLAGERMFADGYRVPGLLHDTTEVRTALCDSLGLFAHGLELEKEHVPCFAPEEGGKGLVVHVEPEKMAAELRERAPKDVDAYRALRGFLGRVGPLLREQTNRLPPPLSPERASDLLDLGMRGLQLRRLGRADMVELIRLLPMCVADVLREQISTEVLSATLAGGVMLGNFVGPWSPGTAANFLLAEANRVPGVKGGPAALASALEKALQTAGGELRTTADVEQIRVDGGRVKGVLLASGEEIDAPLVVSTVDPRQTILDLLPPGAVSLAAESEAHSIRVRGLQAKVHLALKGPLTFPGREGEVFEHIRVGPHLDDLERAFDAGKYRRFADVPHLDIRVPTVRDPSLAKTSGHHVASIVATAAPYDLERGWSPETREAFLDAVLDTLGRYAPGVRDLVVGAEVLSPVDLEEEYGLSGGNLLHGEHALDQLLFMRPGLNLARYSTPVEGLYLGGAGSHPGGGITLAPGALCARVILD